MRRFICSNGSAYLTDNRKYHNFFNGSEVERVHLVATVLQGNLDDMHLQNEDWRDEEDYNIEHMNCGTDDCCKESVSGATRTRGKKLKRQILSLLCLLKFRMVGTTLMVLRTGFKPVSTSNLETF